jgi:hypothetical protein
MKIKHWLILVYFLVTWKSNWIENVGCPQQKVKDPYTGEISNPNMVMALNCTATKESENSKEFTTEKEIIEFRKGCKDYDGKYFYMGSACSDWKVFKQVDFDWNDK